MCVSSSSAVTVQQKLVLHRADETARTRVINRQRAVSSCLHSFRDCLELETHKWVIRSFEERDCSAFYPWPISSPSEDCGGKQLSRGISGWSPAWWHRGDQPRGRPDLVARDIFTSLLVPLSQSLLRRLCDCIYCIDLMPLGSEKKLGFSAYS